MAVPQMLVSLACGFALISCLTRLVSFLAWNTEIWVTITDSYDGYDLLVDIFKDLGLVVLFLLQHRLMSSPTYKDNLQPVLGNHLTAIYTIVSCMTLQVLISNWQPITSVTIWTLDITEHPSLLLFFHLLYYCIWIVIILENLFYVTQIYGGPSQYFYSLLQGFQNWSMPQRMQALFENFPHPGALCFTLVLWLHPVLTLDRWIVATVFTWYMYIPYRVTYQDYKFFFSWKHSLSSVSYKYSLQTKHN